MAEVALKNGQQVLSEIEVTEGSHTYCCTEDGQEFYAEWEDIPQEQRGRLLELER